jgi:hypothetical protein
VCIGAHWRACAVRCGALEADCWRSGTCHKHHALRIPPPPPTHTHFPHPHRTQGRTPCPPPPHTYAQARGASGPHRPASHTRTPLPLHSRLSCVSHPGLTLLAPAPAASMFLPAVVMGVSRSCSAVDVWCGQEAGGGGEGGGARGAKVSRHNGCTTRSAHCTRPGANWAPACVQCRCGWGALSLLDPCVRPLVALMCAVASGAMLVRHPTLAHAPRAQPQRAPQHAAQDSPCHLMTMTEQPAHVCGRTHHPCAAGGCQRPRNCLICSGRSQQMGPAARTRPLPAT